MGTITNRLIDAGIITDYPAFIRNNVMYEVMAGSHAYGVNTDISDKDIRGFCIPPKEVLFPHITGYLIDFDKGREQFKRFDVTHVYHKGIEYDIVIHNIVHWFRLAADCNPDKIDELFVPGDCIIHSTKIGNMVRENRRLFLSRQAWFKYKGYAYSQLSKLRNKNRSGKRSEGIEKHGFDTKFLYHLLRLLDECEQILEFGDLDLRRNTAQLKAAKAGLVSENDAYRIFAEKEKHLEKLYEKSTLPDRAQESKIKTLLLSCLEEHYGNLDNVVTNPTKYQGFAQELKSLLVRHNI